MPENNYTKHDVEVLTKLTELGGQMTQIQKDIKDNNERNTKDIEELQDKVEALEKWKAKVLGIMIVVMIIGGMLSKVITGYIGKLLGG
jgi:ABC-type transport system involved in cytochrome bd biosynthesis fused ATPase/permease subunit